jgi:hypothetical protein
VDDLWEENKLSKQIDYLCGNSSVDMVPGLIKEVKPRVGLQPHPGPGGNCLPGPPTKRLPAQRAGLKI